MNIEQAYLKFLEKVNKNFTNDNIEVDRGRFIMIFNEAQNKIVEWILEKRNEDEIRYIQKLLIYDKKLELNNKILNHENFSLPKDFFSFSNVQVYADSGSCKSDKLYAFEIKQENIEELLQDEFNKPSFEYRETFYSIGSDSINIYTLNEFTIGKVFLTYYRYPIQVDIEGYLKDDGKYSINVNPEFDDKLVDRILTNCAKEFSVNNDNLDKYQVEKDRIYSKI